MVDFSPFTFVVFGLAAYRITRLIVEDTIPFGRIRQAIVTRWPSAADEFVGDMVVRDSEGHHVRGFPRVRLIPIRDPAAPDEVVWYAESPRKVGELVQCPWCMGIWVSAALYAVWYVWPSYTLVGAYVAAAAALVGLLASWER